jgi:hypothetical protein
MTHVVPFEVFMWILADAPCLMMLEAEDAFRPWRLDLPHSMPSDLVGVV